MQPSFPRFSRFVRSGALLLVLTALGAACDRHSAAEAPESYGHGSRHSAADDYTEHRDYTDHQIDSRKQSNHFSDSKGIEPEAERAGGGEGSAVTPKPNEKPATTPNPLGLGR